MTTENTQKGGDPVNDEVPLIASPKETVLVLYDLVVAGQHKRPESVRELFEQILDNVERAQLVLDAVHRLRKAIDGDPNVFHDLAVDVVEAYNDLAYGKDAHGV